MSHTLPWVGQGAVGVPVEISFLDENGAALNLDGMTVAFRFQTSAGVSIQVAATQVAAGSNVARWVSTVDHFAAFGEWRLQGFASSAGVVWPSEVAKFRVLESIAAP